MIIPVMNNISKMTNAVLRKKALKIFDQNLDDIIFGVPKEFSEVTMTQKKSMLAMNKAGLTYRNIEFIFNLQSTNGMTAYRCIMDAKKAKKIS